MRPSDGFPPTHNCARLLLRSLLTGIREIYSFGSQKGAIKCLGPVSTVVGGASGFYVGIVPTLLSMGPSGAAFYTAFDVLANAHRRRFGRPDAAAAGGTLEGVLELGIVPTMVYSGECRAAVLGRIPRARARGSRRSSRRKAD